MAKGKANSSAVKKSQAAAKYGMKKTNFSRMVTVKTANSQEDPLGALPSFKQYSKNGISVKLSTKKLNDLNEETKAVLMNLLESNMKKLYEENNKSWSDKEKMNEMFGDKNGASWYLLAENYDDGTIVGFSHFKFELDYGDEVLYVHEIQVDSKFQTKGLGRFMMQVLEMLAFKANMRKIILTIFKHHDDKVEIFFKNNLKYEIDETCPTYGNRKGSGYKILSKLNKRKIAKEASEQQQFTGCCSEC